jgi:hypothetical protein
MGYNVVWDKTNLKLFCNIFKKFICDSELRDDEFDKCDDEEDYMPDNEYDNAG